MEKVNEIHTKSSAERGENKVRRDRMLKRLVDLRGERGGHRASERGKGIEEGGSTGEVEDGEMETKRGWTGEHEEEASERSE